MEQKRANWGYFFEQGWTVAWFINVTEDTNFRKLHSVLYYTRITKKPPEMMVRHISFVQKRSQGSALYRKKMNTLAPSQQRIC